MNAAGPTCGACGGLNTNPQSPQCRFCGQMLQQQAYGAPPMQQQGYGAPPMQQGYGAPPMQQQGYGANPYGGPAPNPYAQQQYPVQGFGGGQPYGAGYQRSGWDTAMDGVRTARSIFFWIRLGIALMVLSMIALGACVSAISGH